MRKTLYILSAIAVLGSASACSLDLTPLSQGSSENWYSNQDEVIMSLNDLYRNAFYKLDIEFWSDRKTDDWMQRETVDAFCNGSVTASTSIFSTFWSNSYKAISRSIRLLEGVKKHSGDDPSYDIFKAEAHFFIGYNYAYLSEMYGDVPYYDHTITIEEAMAMGRTGKDTVRMRALEELDLAIEGLPEYNTAGDVYRINKSIAKAIKARFCLYWKDYKTARALCKEIMDSKRYSLYYSTDNPADSYGELFRRKDMNTEFIWIVSNSYSYGQYQKIISWVLRTAGGNGVAQPSWDLLASYECTDGQTIDKSPLFNHNHPFANRDPRCNMTFCAPNTVIYGVEFDPDIHTTQVMDYKQGKMVENKDNKRSKNPYAAYNSCCLRKGAQDEWREPMVNENPEILVRYADILLMYAECCIELNEIDQSVLDAINSIRARAYGVQFEEFKSPKYPVITTTDQKELRKIMRRERRVELAWEGRRYFDVRRWGFLEQMNSNHHYGHLEANKLATQLKADPNKWFWPETPKIQTSGIYKDIDCEFWDFTSMYEKGDIALWGMLKYDPKVELFAIPEDEVKCNPKLGQNPGY